MAVSPKRGGGGKASSSGGSYPESALDSIELVTRILHFTAPNLRLGKHPKQVSFLSFPLSRLQLCHNQNPGKRRLVRGDPNHK